MKYRWGVGAILRTTRDLELQSGDLVPKNSIVRIEKRRNGYWATRLAPPKIGFRVNSSDAFELIPNTHWDSIFFQLNDFSDCFSENKLE